MELKLKPGTLRPFHVECAQGNNPMTPQLYLENIWDRFLITFRFGPPRIDFSLYIVYVLYIYIVPCFYSISCLLVIPHLALTERVFECFIGFTRLQKVNLCSLSLTQASETPHSQEWAVYYPWGKHLTIWWSLNSMVNAFSPGRRPMLSGTEFVSAIPRPAASEGEPCPGYSILLAVCDPTRVNLVRAVCFLSLFFSNFVLLKSA